MHHRCSTSSTMLWHRHRRLRHLVMTTRSGRHRGRRRMRSTVWFRRLRLQMWCHHRHRLRTPALVHPQLPAKLCPNQCQRHAPSRRHRWQRLQGPARAVGGTKWPPTADSTRLGARQLSIGGAVSVPRSWSTMMSGCRSCMLGCGGILMPKCPCWMPTQSRSLPPRLMWRL